MLVTESGLVFGSISGGTIGQKLVEFSKQNARGNSD
jgi:xanthine/CO dehydrogenase XdhC/CoxF family maturation factor